MSFAAGYGDGGAGQPAGRLAGYQMSGRDWRAQKREQLRASPLDLYNQRMSSQTPYYEGTMCKADGEPIGQTLRISNAAITPLREDGDAFLKRAAQVLGHVLQTYIENVRDYSDRTLPNRRAAAQSIKDTEATLEWLNILAGDYDPTGFYWFDDDDSIQIAAYLLARAQQIYEKNAREAPSEYQQRSFARKLSDIRGLRDYVDYFWRARLDP